MIVKTVGVRRFRSLLDCTLSCSSLTALVGPNGAGKSCYLRALELFYSPSPRVSQDDFYAEDTGEPIEVELTFTELGAEAKSKFALYVNGDDLTVVRVVSLEGGKVSATFHGVRLQVPAFIQIRNTPKVAESKPLYEQVTKKPEFAALPKWSNKELVLAALDKFETAHPELCSRQRDDGQFFGFAEGAQGYLGRYTKFILVPAVRDAAGDAAEGKGSAITEIMDLVVRRALSKRADLVALKKDAQKKYQAIMASGNLPEFQALEEDLSRTIGAYAPGASVALDWRPAQPLELPLPVAEVRLREDGYQATVSRTGHGLQRAFVLTLLQYLAAARAPGDGHVGPTDGAPGGGPELSGLVLGIEEPELYQHPSRQRHLAQVLLRLAEGGLPGIAARAQVVYCTHSPLFVGLDRFDQVRKLVKRPVAEGKPKATSIVTVTLSEVAEALWEAAGRPAQKFTADTLRPRLQTLLTPWMNEGFFADLVVLVEGEDDRAVVLGTASHLGHDFDAMGIAVIPCGGKTALDRPYLIFQRLGVPVFIVWDSDEGENDSAKGKPEMNRLLLRLLGRDPEDWPSGVEGEYAVFKGTLEVTLRTEIGAEHFDTIRAELQQEGGIGGRGSMKNPVLLRQLLSRAAADGRRSATLEAIVSRIIALRKSAA